MEQSGRLYTILHYLVLMALIFGIIWALELAAESVPIWAGLAIALVVGLLYPRATRRLGVAPDSWQ